MSGNLGRQSRVTHASCLAMFWVCVNHDLKPFRPIRAYRSRRSTGCALNLAKFLCVKGILFFSFWQSVAISLFVSVGIIKRGTCYPVLNVSQSHFSRRVYRPRAYVTCTRGLVDLFRDALLCHCPRKWHSVNRLLTLAICFSG